ncbi:MAG: hypothetical protein ACP5G5_04990 [Thermoplasmata archaeon]
MDKRIVLDPDFPIDLPEGAVDIIISITDREKFEKLPAIYMYIKSLSKSLKKEDIRIELGERVGVWIGEVFFYARELSISMEKLDKLLKSSFFVHIPYVKMIPNGIYLVMVFEGVAIDDEFWFS